MTMPDREPMDGDAMPDAALLSLLRRGAATPPPPSADLAARITAAAELPLRRRARSEDATAGVLATWARLVLPLAAAAGIALAVLVRGGSAGESVATSRGTDQWSLLHDDDGDAGQLLTEQVVSLEDDATDDDEAW